MWEFAPKQVHCWLLTLDRFLAVVPELLNDLCLEEREQVHRFAFDGDRIRFTICRATLRRLLERYGAGSASQLQFVRSERGKPRLLEGARPEIVFNVTHSANRAAIAVAHDCQVGVDIESIRPLADLAGLARMSFSPEEQCEFWSLPESVRVPAFFAGWTRKEAFLKATGEGLSRPMTSFTVSIAPNIPPRLLRVPADLSVCNDWTLVDLTQDDRFAAALAVDRPGATVVVRDLLPVIVGLQEMPREARPPLMDFDTLNGRSREFPS